MAHGTHSGCSGDQCNKPPRWRGGGAPSSLGPKNTFLVFLPDCKAPDRQWGTAVKVELTDLQNILACSFFLFVVMARIINTNVKQDTDIAAWKM